MREVNKISESLFEKIRDRFDDVSLGDAEANAVSDPAKARFFNFDYTVEGKNYGNITISLVDELSLKVYYSKNITQNLNTVEKQKWYGFLKELREFSKRNLLSFEPRDITRPTLKHRDIKQVSKSDDTFDKDDVLAEGHMYGTNRTSYENGNNVRIMVRHSDAIDPERRGARSRKIASIFLETSDGERFKLPMNSLSYARAMARHLAEGGTMHDDFGKHITEVADECSKLRPFRAAMVRRVFEDSETQRMVEAAFEYHSQLKHTLSKMSGTKGYKQCKEEFETTGSYINEEDTDVDAIRERFVKRVFSDRMESALPIVQKAYNMKKENRYAKQFESWASSVVEGTWAIPDSDESINELSELLAEELPIGVDAVNATAALYNIIGDDALFDLLGSASDEDPDADARPIILGWLENNMPEIFNKLTDDPESQYELGGELDESEGTSNAVFSTNLNSYPEEWAQELVNELPKTFKAGVDYKLWIARGDDWANYIEVYNPAVLEDENINDIIMALATDEEYEGNPPDEQLQEDDWDDADDSVDSVVSAITNRILRQHTDLLSKLGPEKLLALIQDEAEYAAPVQEIGGSDVSAWIKNIYQAAGLQQGELAEDSSKPYGLRYKMFAGRDDRIVTKEKWFATEEQREKFAEKIQDDGKFYEIDSYGSLNEGWFSKKSVKPVVHAKPNDLVIITKTHPQLDIIPGDSYRVVASGHDGVIINHNFGTRFRDIPVPHDSYKVAGVNEDVDDYHKAERERMQSPRELAKLAQRARDEKWARERANSEQPRAKDVLNNMFGGDAKELTKGLKIKEDQIDAGEQVWGVRIKNNYYAGKYYDYSSHAYPVLANSEEEAIQLVLTHADEVLQDLMTKRLHSGKKLVSPSHPVKITAREILDAKPMSITTMKPKKMLTAQGFADVMLSNGKRESTDSLGDITKLAGL